MAPQRAVRGVTLLELLIVMAIIGIMLGLLLPALWAARKAAERSACNNNIRQIVLALGTYEDVTNGMFPFPPVPEYPSGWAIAILPYIEDAAVADRFDYRQPLWAPANLQVAKEYRPPLYCCTVTPEVDSTQPGVGVTNYVVVVDNTNRRKRWRDRSWKVKDATDGARIPWVTSPENPEGPYEAPHPPLDETFGIGF